MYLGMKAVSYTRESSSAENATRHQTLTVLLMKSQILAAAGDMMRGESAGASAAASAAAALGTGAGGIFLGGPSLLRLAEPGGAARLELAAAKGLMATGASNSLQSQKDKLKVRY